MFSITCTTCKARLKVRSEEAIGAILECPKCNSMVHIVPPEGWEPTETTAAMAAGLAGPLGDAAGTEPLPEAEAAAGVCETEALAAAAPAGLRGSPAELMWRKRLLLGAAPVAGLIVAVGVWSIFASRGDPEPSPTVAIERPAEPAPAKPPEVPETKPEPLPSPVGWSEGISETITDDGHEDPTGAAPDGDPAEPQLDADQPQPDAQENSPEPPIEPSPEQPDRQPNVEPDEPPDEPPVEPPVEPGPDSDGPPELVPEDPLEAQPVRVVTGPPPAKVDVAARLADKIPEIELREMPLAEAVELLGQLSTVPFTFDTEAMLRLGVTPRDPVTVRLADTTVARTLEAVVSGRGLVPVVEDGQVLLTAPPDERQTLRQRRYTVSDLVGNDPAEVAELALLVQKLVAPDSWRACGGRGTVQPDGDALGIEQTTAVHYQIFVFCEKLRKARGKPLKSRAGRMNPDRFALITRRDRAQEALSRPVTVNFRRPVPLVQIVAHLGELTGTDLLVDRAALAAVGLSPKVEAALQVQKQPLTVALEELLRPLGLAYRVIDAGTLQVTTQEAAADRLHLEFYQVAELLADGRTGQSLAGQIRGSLAAASWSDAGGRGVLHFDHASGCLIVLQSQPVQAAVRQLLARQSQVAAKSPGP